MFEKSEEFVRRTLEGVIYMKENRRAMCARKLSTANVTTMYQAENGSRNDSEKSWTCKRAVQL